MVYYWFSWLGIIFFSFFSTYHITVKRLIVIGLMFNVILINFHIQVDHLTFTLPYLYCLAIFWLITIMKSTNYFNYYLLFCLIIMYVGFRYLFITSPIWVLANEFFLIALVFMCILLIFVRAYKERIILLVTSCLTGEWLFAYNVQKLNWHIIVGDAALFSSLYLVIFLMILFHLLTFSYKVT
ncbi:YphA family membrane protein [Amphibacillus sp. Q70]|uniref:YphA family membrane protein n=1 Tax=Amphibacillus sp. Q70 TaxID=3453416 RepID=UPI003F83EA26